MLIFYFNRQNSKIPISTEGEVIYSNLLFAEACIYMSPAMLTLTDYFMIPLLNDDEIVKGFLLQFENTLSKNNELEKIREMYTYYKKTLNAKRKGKEDMKFLVSFRNLVQGMRKDLALKFKGCLSDSNLFEVYPFVKDELLFIVPVDYKDSEDLQDFYIGPVIGAISEKGITIFIDDFIEENFSFTNIDELEKEMFDFIKIPLWELPSFHEITYQETKYTRDQLLDILKPFKTQLQEIKTELFGSLYIQENLDHAKQLYKEKISVHIAPIQDALDESIYLSKQRNKYKDKSGFTYCLGITSVKNMVSFLEKAEVILPYVASEIKEQISKQLDLQTNIVFSYCKMHDKRKDTQDVMI